MINPIWIVSFVQVVNRGTMAAAAQHLRITSAAVSKHILSLENLLGIPLFKRSTRHIELTQEGILYLEHAKQIIKAYQKAEAAISYTREEPSGLLKILCGPQIGNLFVLPYIKEFLVRHPKLRLHIELTQTLPDLEKEKVDVVVGLTAGIPTHWIQRTIARARWVFCASPEYLKHYGEPKKPSDLMQHQIITRMQRQPNNLIEFKTGETIVFEPYLYLNDTRAIRRCVLHGLGIAQLHDYIISQDLKEKRLIEVLKKHTPQSKSIPVHLSFFPAAHVHIKVQRFMAFVKEVSDRINVDSTQ